MLCYRWRFEALKNRCIIIDRESLLEKHSIPFKIFKNVDFNITNKMKEEATPKVAYDEVVNESVKFDVYVDTEPVERTPLRPMSCPKEDKENSPYFMAAELQIKRSEASFKGSPLLERHMSPRFPKIPLPTDILVMSPRTPVSGSAPSQGYFEIYEDSTTQNLAYDIKILEPKVEPLKNQEGNEENKENDPKQEVVESFVDLTISDVKVKQELKSGSTVVVRRVFIPSSSKDKPV